MPPRRPRRTKAQIAADRAEVRRIARISRRALIYRQSGWARLVPPDLKKSTRFREHWLKAFSPEGSNADDHYVWDHMLREAKETNDDQAWDSFREVYDVLVYGF